MSGISTSLSIRDRFSNTINKATQGVNRMLKSMKDLDVQSLRASPAKAFTYAKSAIVQSKQKVDEFIQKQRQAAGEAKKVKNEWSGIGNAIQGALVTFGVTKILGLADSMTTTKARLDLMNDGLQTTEELQNRIMESANRSRASYQTTADAVAKMGIMAKDAFNSNDELIMFSELINKQFTIAGTSTAGVDAAMLQLTQAMGSGVLRGEELNSVFEQAPTIIQTIADYLNVPIGKIRKMAENGELTATVVKNAMLSSGDEINKKFNSMPMTFAQVWVVSMNALLKVFGPLLQTIGQGAQWINDNWSKIAPIFWGLVAAALAVAAGFGIQAAATWIANGALVALLTNPVNIWIFAIAIAIGLVVAAIYKWIQAVGGLKIAWMIVCNSLLTAWDWVKIGFFTGVYWVIDLWNIMQISWMRAVVAIQNWAGDLKVSVLGTLQDLVNGAIDTINKLINMANKIKGVSIEMIDQVTFGTSAKIENEAAKQDRKQNLAQYQGDINKQITDRNKELEVMKSDARIASAARKAEVAAAQAEKASKSVKEKEQKFNMDKVEKVGEVGKIKNDVNIAEEDLQLMKDVAEMRYVQNFVTLTPKVSMNAQISKEVDVDVVMNELERRLDNEIASNAEGFFA